MKWTEEEKNRLIDCEWSQDCESIDRRLEVARDIMILEGFPKRTLSADKTMFYKFLSSKLKDK